MIEFLQTYGLWIALAGVFIVMHRFGMGCCGGGHQHGAPPEDKTRPRETAEDEKVSPSASKTSGSCH